MLAFTSSLIAKSTGNIFSSILNISVKVGIFSAMKVDIYEKVTEVFFFCLQISLKNLNSP